MGETSVRILILHSPVCRGSQTGAKCHLVWSAWMLPQQLLGRRPLVQASVSVKCFMHVLISISISVMLHTLYSLVSVLLWFNVINVCHRSFNGLWTICKCWNHISHQLQVSLQTPQIFKQLGRGTETDMTR